MINDLWYKNAIIYCLSVGTFMDANGDGIGDFEGLMRRLDYLHGLGVTGDLADAVPDLAAAATTATTSPTTTASTRATARSATSSSSPTAPSSAASG